MTEIEREKLKQRYIEALERDDIRGVENLCCKKLGVSYVTIWTYKKEDEEFRQKVEEARMRGRQKIADSAEAALMSRIQAGDTTAIIFALKNLRKEYYGSGINDNIINIQQEQSKDSEKATEILAKTINILLRRNGNKLAGNKK